MKQHILRWFIATPSSAARNWSIGAALGASTLAFADSASLFWQIVAGEVVAVPRIDGVQVTTWTGVGTLGVWALGTVAFAHRSTRVRVGWLAPLGVLAASSLDRQVFTDITYLIVLAFALHWWSARLRETPYTVHLWGVPLRVLQAQISIVFLWTAFAKLNPRFLSGGVLSVSFGGPVPPPEFVFDRQALVALAVLTIVSEATLAIAIWMKSVRRLALVGAAGFHVFILMFFQPTLALAAFSLVMASGYVLFASEPWLSARSLAQR